MAILGTAPSGKGRDVLACKNGRLIRTPARGPDEAHRGLNRLLLTSPSCLSFNQPLARHRNRSIVELAATSVRPARLPRRSDLLPLHRRTDIGSPGLATFSAVSSTFSALARGFGEATYAPPLRARAQAPKLLPRACSAAGLPAGPIGEDSSPSARALPFAWDEMRRAISPSRPRYSPQAGISVGPALVAAFQAVGGRDEHDVGQVIIEFQIMVLEAAVRSGQAPEQRRSRIAAEIRAELSISSSRNSGLLVPAFKLVMILPARANVRPAMAANSLRPHHAHDCLAIRGRRTSDRAAERGLPNAGGPRGTGWDP